MISTTLIVPGVGGSGAEHWQTWFEHQIQGAVRVEQGNWEEPILHVWAGKIRRAIDIGRGPVWIVAHSFGCLAAVAAAQDRRERIAGAMLVAPADPDRFTPDGLRDNGEAVFVKSITPLLPDQHLGFPTLLVASENDPWAGLMISAYLAGRWGSRFLNIGAAGHINVDAGFGAWPQGIALFEELRATQGGLPLGSIANSEERRRTRARTRRIGQYDWRNHIEHSR